MNATPIIEALACGSPVCACARSVRLGSGVVHCLVHTDANPSLNVSHANGKLLVKCHGGCSQDAVVSALRTRELWPTPDAEKVVPTIVATYPFVDERGATLFEEVREFPKAFRVRRPDGHGGWIWNAQGVRRVLWDLPDVLSVAGAGWRVYVVEGPKDASVVKAQGLCATTNPFGAGKWRQEFSVFLSGADVVIIPDKDDAGRAHAQVIAASCVGKAKSIKLLELPGDQVKDVSDWFSAGGTKAELERLADAAPRWDRTPPKSETALKDGARAIVASSVKRQRVEYLDAERMIPLGAATALAGPPGLGKSQWTAKLAASNDGVTLMATAEDSLSAVVRPRLEAAGADISRVHFVVMRRDGNDEGIDLPDNIAELERLVVETGANLVVIDPLMAHLPDSVNSWRDQSIRRAFAPLHRLAEERACAVVVVIHLNKREGDDPLQRVGGSIGITAAARSVLLLARDPDDPEGEAGSRRVLAHVKHNYGPMRSSLALRIEPILVDPEGEHIDTSRIVVTGESAHLGRDLLAEVDRDEGKRGDAVEFLLGELRDGPRPQFTVIEGGSARGIKEKTLRRAKKDIGVRSEKVGFGKEGAWFWALPGGRGKDGHGGDNEVAILDRTSQTQGFSASQTALDGHADTPTT